MMVFMLGSIICELDIRNFYKCGLILGCLTTTQCLFLGKADIVIRSCH
jgi:hypothetical protein